MRLRMHSGPRARLLLVGLSALAGATSAACLDWEALYGPAATDPIALWDFEGRLASRSTVISDRAPREPNVGLQLEASRTSGLALERGALQLGGGRARPSYRASAALLEALAVAPGFSFEGWLEAPAGRGGFVMLLGPNGRSGTGTLTVLTTTNEAGVDELHVLVRVVQPARDAAAPPPAQLATATIPLGIPAGATARTLHLAVTHARETGLLTIYVDGDRAREWDSRAAERTVAIWDEAYAGDWVLAFGADAAPNAGGNHWSGRIALFAFYDRALPEAEVQALFAQGPGR